jgi:hypothetical protein
MNRRSGRVPLQAGEGYWFVPHAFGFGATPVTWQGWALTLGFVALVAAVARLLPGNEPKVAVGLAVTVLFVVICWRKTDGGWRWRWGRGD